MSTALANSAIRCLGYSCVVRARHFAKLLCRACPVTAVLDGADSAVVERPATFGCRAAAPHSGARHLARDWGADGLPSLVSLTFAHARLWIRRLKRGLDVEHPIAGDELRAIKRYMASRTDALPWLFISESWATVHASIGELSHRLGGRACRVAASTSAHAAALLRLLAGKPRLRPAPDPRLPWASRSQAHRSRYTRRRRALRGALALSPGVFTLKATKLLPFWSVGQF
jgi:hypothetical protein